MTTIASDPQPTPLFKDANYKPAPGHLGNLDATQQTAFDTFKQQLVNDGTFNAARMDDLLLLRFLRARQFDVTRTMEMFLANEKWRKDEGVDDIYENFKYTELPEVLKYYPQFYHKTDIDGRPLHIEQLGKIDINSLYKVTSLDRQRKHLIWEYEHSYRFRLPACAAEAGHPVETFCTIIDLQNVSLVNFYRVKDYVNMASKMGQDNYPESLGKFYIVNAPYLFSTVWSVIKPWLDPVTVSKIDILGYDYKNVVLKQVPAENLPKDLGGTCNCVGGCAMSDAGVWKEVEQEKSE